ncbi:MAG: ubiquinol-cytochrome c reductase iron-sulfur subunit [Arenicellales bacterium]
MAEDHVDKHRRRFLTAVTTGVGAVGGIAAAVPFVVSMTPSARARAEGAPVRLEIGKLEAGQMLREQWRGQPIFVVNRTKAMLDSLDKDTDLLLDPKSTADQQPSYADNKYRSIKPEFLVVIGVCTHLGCVPVQKFTMGADSGMGADWPGGFFCPCHGSKYDLSGRVFKNVPAPLNLQIPPYRFETDTTVVVGENPKGAA